MTSNDARAVRRLGLQHEFVVKRYIEDVRGLQIRQSSDFEDRRLDTDFHVLSSQGNWIPISVKTNEPKYFHSPFLFELETGWIADDGSVRPTLSWFFTGKAKYYLVWKRRTSNSGTLWLLSKSRICAYVDNYGFDAETQTSGVARSREINEGKAYTKLGLLEQSTVIEHKLGTEYGHITKGHTKKYSDEYKQNRL